MIKKLLKLCPMVLTSATLPFMVACNDKTITKNNGENNNSDNDASAETQSLTLTTATIFKEFRTQNRITLENKLAEKEWNLEQQWKLREYSHQKGIYVQSTLEFFDLVKIVWKNVLKMYNNNEFNQETKKQLFDLFFNNQGEEELVQERQERLDNVNLLLNDKVLEKIKLATIPYADVFEFTYFQFRSLPETKGLTINNLNEREWDLPVINKKFEDYVGIFSIFTFIIHESWFEKIKPVIIEKITQITKAYDTIIEIELEKLVKNNTSETFITNDFGVKFTQDFWRKFYEIHKLIKRIFE
ncbi:hypothetical protein [Mycoplasmopsis gallinacea]|uniref:Lipoprotein n=1 Tax=Mycoplasmopsis gallinacea TaxID=29556 RepID=A0A6H0V647_9BACT|nr:hypothetical protein [Mycoplasmopsis gallinacea]QIW62507.1 hypothetical protein GOQ20_03755 [Mycoplasmopsis gallinacea]